MTLIADYTITETLQEDDGSALYRATSKRDRHSVLLKTLVLGDRPQAREVARLRHEGTLASGLLRGQHPAVERSYTRDDSWH